MYLLPSALRVCHPHPHRVTVTVRKVMQHLHRLPTPRNATPRHAMSRHLLVTFHHSHAAIAFPPTPCYLTSMPYLSQCHVIVSYCCAALLLRSYSCYFLIVIFFSSYRRHIVKFMSRSHSHVNFLHVSLPLQLESIMSFESIYLRGVYTHHSNSVPSLLTLYMLKRQDKSTKTMTKSLLDFPLPKGTRKGKKCKPA